MLTHDDFTEIKQVLDSRYVLQADCNDKQSAVSRKFANDDKRIEMVVHDFATIKKLIWIVATSAIGQIVLEIMSVLKGV